jgi:hypothetical protein
MLMIRHAIGSRLFFQTDKFCISQKDTYWEISTQVTSEAAEQIMKFHNELNIFEVGKTDKTWFYSSDANIKVRRDDNFLVILADHKTVYPK